MEENMETLINMGFTDRELNLKALNKAGNDISEAVTYLTNPDFGHDEVMIASEPPTNFIGPLTKEQVEQQQNQQIVKRNRFSIVISIGFFLDVIE